MTKVKRHNKKSNINWLVFSVDDQYIGINLFDKTKWEVELISVIQKAYSLGRRSKVNEIKKVLKEL